MVEMGNRASHPYFALNSIVSGQKPGKGFNSPTLSPKLTRDTEPGEWCASILASLSKKAR